MQVMENTEELMAFMQTTSATLDADVEHGSTEDDAEVAEVHLNPSTRPCTPLLQGFCSLTLFWE